MASSEEDALINIGGSALSHAGRERLQGRGDCPSYHWRGHSRGATMPKRSAGCFECRKRKVRCDEAKPECSNCLRRGIQCPGYRPTQSFILHNFNAHGEKPALIKEDENAYRYASQTSPSEQKNFEIPLGQTLVHRNSITTEDPHLPKQVSPVAADRIQHLGTFIALYLPRAEGPALPPPSALMLGLPNMPANSNVLMTAIDALSAAQLAVANRNSLLVHRSRSLYGTALSQLLRAIQDSEKALKDETLLSTYLLTLYEVFVGVAQGYGFFYHVQGLLHLLKQRGPASFQSRQSMQIYHAIRYNSLTIGYHMRKASMLDTPDWLAVTAKAAKVDPYVALQDICIAIPRILERTDKLAKDCPKEEVESLIDDAQQVASRAFDWFSHFERHGPRYNKVDVATMVGFSEICPDLDGGGVFNSVFAFHYFGAGICYLIYWMSMLILQSNTFKLLRRHRQLDLKELMTWDRQLSNYADSICRSVPYHCRPVTGYTGKFGSLTPLMVARKFYEMKGAKTEAAWCIKVYMGARVPELYSAEFSLDPLDAVKDTVKNNPRII
ncbi:c6 zinc finger domain [Pyrenophora seminiperda CCB06]|uniref:C6 zinc finger domain n=1 Tax=Pyrenophora seminiperda CCB06 TaxID=1302712 RepID=A0A3M7M0E8_9PLEO|nr:c6 zinc finger domain [Pyrenophora seminiperda CCB06]